MLAAQGRSFSVREFTSSWDVELRNVITQLYKTIQLPNDTIGKEFDMLNHVLDDGLRFHKLKR